MKQLSYFIGLIGSTVQLVANEPRFAYMASPAYEVAGQEEAQALFERQNIVTVVEAVIEHENDDARVEEDSKESHYNSAYYFK